MSDHKACHVCGGDKKCIGCHGSGQVHQKKCALCRGDRKCYNCSGTGQER